MRIAATSACRIPNTLSMAVTIKRLTTACFSFTAPASAPPSAPSRCRRWENPGVTMRCTVPTGGHHGRGIQQAAVGREIRKRAARTQAIGREMHISSRGAIRRRPPWPARHSARRPWPSWESPNPSSGPTATADITFRTVACMIAGSTPSPGSIPNVPISDRMFPIPFRVGVGHAFLLQVEPVLIGKGASPAGPHPTRVDAACPGARATLAPRRRPNRQ